MHQGILDHASRINFQRILAFEETGPGAVDPILVLYVGFLAGALESLLTDLVVFVFHVFDLLLRYDALLDQLLGILLEKGFYGLDFTVHKGLGEHGLIDLVVAVPAVAHQIDDDILVEGSSPLGRHVTDVIHTFRIISVNMENGCVYHTSNICNLNLSNIQS